MITGAHTQVCALFIGGIMQIIEPGYYSRFRCIASQCPDSCCKEWEVEVDEAAASLYRSLPGDLGDKLRQVLRDDPEWGTVMTIENGRCPMWRADGLCRIHAELGHEALCKTCREFPRLRHDYSSFAELGLELSCPEAARLILTCPSQPPIVRQADGGEQPDYDEKDMSILLETRRAALALLDNPEYSVPQALILMYFQALHAQTLLDGGEPPAFVPAQILQTAGEFGRPGDYEEITAFFRGLEILTPEWSQRLSAPLSPAPWSDGFRNLARYFAERYWLQAVSDLDIVSRAKFTLIACLFIHHLGGDFIETAQLFSKEIENSDQNLDALLDAAYTSPAFTDERIMGLLLNS